MPYDETWLDEQAAMFAIDQLFMSGNVNKDIWDLKN